MFFCTMLSCVLLDRLFSCVFIMTFLIDAKERTIIMFVVIACRQIVHCICVMLYVDMSSTCAISGV